MAKLCRFQSKSVVLAAIISWLQLYLHTEAVERHRAYT